MNALPVIVGLRGRPCHQPGDLRAGKEIRLQAVSRVFASVVHCHTDHQTGRERLGAIGVARLDGGANACMAGGCRHAADPSSSVVLACPGLAAPGMRSDLYSFCGVVLLDALGQSGGMKKFLLNHRSRLRKVVLLARWLIAKE